MTDKKLTLNADLDLPAEIREKLANYEKMEARAQRADAIEAERNKLKQLLSEKVSPHLDMVSLDDNGKPSYKHMIDLPPVGGFSIRINGVDFFHGQVYDLDEDMMRCIMDIEYRCWQHERSIRGSNENAYRRQFNNTLGPNGVINTRRSLMG